MSLPHQALAILTALKRERERGNVELETLLSSCLVVHVEQSLNPNTTSLVEIEKCVTSLHNENVVQRPRQMTTSND